MRTFPFGRVARLVAVSMVAHAAAARADSLNLRYVPSYTYAKTTTTGADGVTTETETQLFPQRFILNLDKSIFPMLTWSASGLLDWNKAWIQDETNAWTTTDSKRWVGNTRLELGSEVLRSSMSYTRLQAESEARRSSGTMHNDSPVNETYALALMWRPSDLPTANLSLSRQDGYDTSRTLLNQTNNNASLALDYGLQNWQFHYGYQYLDALDRVRDGETVSHIHAARVGWGSRYLGGDLNTFASYGVGTTSTRTSSGSGGATRETLRVPLAGLSRVEAFPDVPGRVTLQPNPALVDAVLGGGVGIDLGYGRTNAGDTAYRDVGAQFPEDRQDLNTILVYVDRPLSDGVAAALSWEAWVGDDNLNWTRVQVIGVPAFNILQNRFQITVDRTRARYVKVIARPLGSAVTTEPQYAEILVTELQFSLVEPLPPGVARTRETSGTLNGGLRYVLLREPSLTYDVAFALTHHDPPLRARESLQQTLGLVHRLATHTQLSARLVRSDSHEDAGHFGQNGWGASLTSEPLPTLGLNLNYSGTQSSTPGGTEFSNGVNGGIRADLYDGVSSNAGVGYRYGESSGRFTQAATASTGLTVTPHRALTASGTFAWSYTDAWGTGGSLSDRVGRVEGSVAFNPFPAAYLAVSAGRYVFTTTPATQTAISAGLSIFQGGGLTLRGSFSQTDETLSRTRGRNYGAGLTWTILRGRSLTVTFNHLESKAPVERLDVDSVFASLQIPAF